MDRRLRLVCIPSTDTDFAAFAAGLLEARFPDGSPDMGRAAFERALRERYPAAVVRAQEALATLAPGTERIWYATNRAYPSRISARIEVPGTPETVFGIYVERFPEWQPAIRLRRIENAAEPTGIEYAGSYTLFGRTLEGRFRVVDAEPPRFVRVEATGGGGIRVWYATTFAPGDDGTIIDVVGSYDVPGRLLPRVGRVIIERAIAGEIERAHAALHALCAREGPKRP